MLFFFSFCFCEEKVPAESRKHDVTVRSSPESQRIIQMFVQRELKLSFYQHLMLTLLYFKGTVHPKNENVNSVITSSLPSFSSQITTEF